MQGIYQGKHVNVLALDEVCLFTAIASTVQVFTNLNSHFLSFSLPVLHRRVKTEEPASRISAPTLLIVFVKKVSSENSAKKVTREYVWNILSILF